ncbi:Leukocyte receptor cluster (LRC) member 8 [Desmophyllum pertusum]|uniref:Leukocyte receptor cluster (LRC) member 8 n=1 Tax=Desmophyllum pertusum TaxID=174260 RepID=A0A9W9ZYL3_9CNID|nr:Leukocyte receptor cluster (LRC) member 8 [Desmophyllum pertusum]
MITSWNAKELAAAANWSRQYSAAAPDSKNENNENSESTEGSKQTETPEWERARQALAKVNSEVTKSPVKSSPKANNSNTSSAPSSIQQQTLAYQQYYQQYYPQWNGFTPYQYPYTGYVPAYTMPPPQPSVPPPPPYQPSPPAVSSSTASSFNSTENSNTSATEQTSENNSFSNYSRSNTYQSRQPWQSRNQQRPSFSHQNEKEELENDRDKGNRLGSQMTPPPVFVPRQQRSSYADAVKRNGENGSNNNSKQFWKQQPNHRKWTPGGNVNNNNFPSPNAKKFRPTFEGESGPSQDERYSPLPRTEASKPTSPNWRPQQQQQQQPPRRPKREESPPEKDTREEISVPAQEWPPSLREYVQRAFEKCETEIDKDQTEQFLKNMLTSAFKDGTAWVVDWDKEPLPSFKKSPHEDKKLPRWHPSRRRSPPVTRRRKERSRGPSRSRSRSRSRSKSRSVSPENKTRTKGFDPKRLGKKTPKPKGKGGKGQKGKKECQRATNSNI